MTSGQGHEFDELGFDYSLGQALEGLSILELRGRLPTWAITHVSLLEAALASPEGVPSHVTQAAAAACQAHGYSIPILVDELHNMASIDSVGAGLSIRTLRAFLVEWRMQMRKLRPVPKFRQQAR